MGHSMFALAIIIVNIAVLCVLTTDYKFLLVYVPIWVLMVAGFFFC